MWSPEDQTRESAAATAAKAELTGLHFKAKADWDRDVEFHSRSLDVKGKHTLRITSPERGTNLPA